jgi:murein DD-endopeptidase MepM/ murein hydrolase activator NlpD
MAAGAAGTDVRQLLLQVDASVSLAQRGLSQLAAQVAREANQMEGNLERPAVAAERMGQRFNQVARGTTASLGQMRAASQQLSFQIGDVAQGFALGTKPMTIFAQQSGQVIQALTLMGGTSNKFLTFLGGPWGAVITGAGLVLTMLAGKIGAASDEVDKAVDKLRKQHDQTLANEKADRIWMNTIEGLTDAIRKRREEQDKALQSDIQAEEASLRAARDELTKTERKTEEVAQALRDAKAELSDVKARPALGEVEQGIKRNEVAAAEARVNKLRSELATMMRNIEDARTEIRKAEIPIDQRAVEAQLDSVKMAVDRYTRAEDALNAAKAKGEITSTQYRSRLKEEKRLLKEAEDAARSRTKTENDLTRFQMPISGATSGAFGEWRGNRKHGGVDIAARVGTAVKAPAAGVVIESGVVGDYGNVIFIDHGRGTISRLAHLSRLDAKRGDVVQAGDVIGLSGGARGAPGSGNSRGPHLHYEVRVGGKAVNPATGQFPTDPGRVMAADARGDLRRAEREEEEERRRIAGLVKELGRTEEQILASRVQTAGTVDDLRLAELRLLEHQFQRELSELDLVEATSEEGKAAKERARIALELRYEQQRALINQKAVNEASEQALLNLVSGLGLRREDLQGQLALARTQEERRRVELELLDIAYRIREAELRRAEASARLAGNIEEADRIQAEINSLPERRRQDTERVNRDTQGPLAAWADQVPKDAAEINEALESIAARGLDSLTDSLTAVAMGTKDLADAFKEIAASIVADITKMIIKMLIFRALSSALPGLFGGGYGGGGNSLSGSFSPSEGFPDIFKGGLPGRARGGPVWAGRAYMVGEDGPEPFVPRENGMIIPSGALGGRAQEVIVHVAASEDFEVKVERKAQRVVQQSAPAIVAASQRHTVRSLQRPRLP